MPPTRRWLPNMGLGVTRLTPEKLIFDAPVGVER